MPTIKTNFKIDGEEEYKRAIKEINAENRTLKSEMALVSEQYKKNADSTEALTKKGRILDDQIAKQNEAISVYEKALAEAKNTANLNVRALSDWETGLNNARKELAKLENQLDDNNNALEKATRETKEFDEAQDDIIEGSVTLGDALDGIAGKFGVEIPGGIGKVLGPLGEVNLGFAGLIGVAGAAASKIWEVAQETAEWANEITKQSAVTGLSVESLQKLEAVAVATGTEVDSLIDGTKDLTERVKEAAEGNEEYTAAFNKLGVAIKDNNGQLRSMDEIYMDVITGLQSMEEGIERDALAMSLMGESARELNPVLNMTAEEMNGVIESARIMSDETVENIDKMRTRAKAILKDLQDSFRAGIGEIADWLAGDLQYSGLHVESGQQTARPGHNAAGTSYWRGGLTWVGEEGPELVNLPRGSAVYTAQESKAMAAPTINIYGAPGQDVNAIADAVAHKLYGDVVRRGAVFA